MDNPGWWIPVFGVLAAIGWTAWTGFRPRPQDSHKWYDRAIRALGGLIILAVLIFGIVLKVLDSK